MEKVGPWLIGQRLRQDVRLPDGDLLYTKEQVLTSFDIDFLRAFQIEAVDVYDQEQNALPLKNVKDTSRRDKAKGEQTEAISCEYEPCFSLEDIQHFKQTLKEHVHTGPLPIAMWLEMIRSWIEHRSSSETIFSLLPPLRKRPVSDMELYFAEHALYTARLTLYLAIQLGLTDKLIERLALAGLLADIGMWRLPTHTFWYRETYTDTMRKTMETHVSLSFERLKHQLGLPKETLAAVLAHHERMDGSGYPLRLKGERLSIVTHLLAYADSIHAALTPRPYRSAKTWGALVEEFRLSQRHAYDATLFRVLDADLKRLPSTVRVLLSDGSWVNVQKPKDWFDPWYPLSDKTTEPLPLKDIVRICKDS